MTHRCTFLNVSQRSPAWFRARTVVATASNFHRILAKGQGLSRAAYLQDLALDAVSGKLTLIRPTTAMKWGSAHEAEARAEFSRRLKKDVQQVGFVELNGYRVGGSPDGILPASSARTSPATT